MKFGFLNTKARNKRFEYTPMYYDERKEALERKREQYEKLNSGKISDEERRELFRDKVRGEMTRGQYRQGKNRSANIRVLLLVGLLLALGYFIFSGMDQVDAVVKKVF